MRIPPSVFVMSLVTAVPFGLAVRDTLHPRPKTLADLTDDEREAQYEADMQKQLEADRAAEEQRKHTVYDRLLGAPGKLGPYLDNLALGVPTSQAEAVEARIANASDMILVSHDEAQDVVTSLRVESTGTCEDLEQAIHRAWGQDSMWVDAATHTKASFNREMCTLSIDHYVEIDQLLDKTLTASIPAGAIGKTLDAVPGLGDADQLSSPGLANTTGPVTVRFTTDDNGKIVGLSASFGAEVEADATIRTRLDKLFGKGKQDPDTGEWDWKGKTPVHYAYSSAHVYLDIGRP